MSEQGESELRRQAAEHATGASLSALASSDELLGRWEMRFGGPIGSDRVQWIYQFSRGGEVNVGDELWRWRLNANGTLSLLVTTPPNPAAPGLEYGASTEEVRYPFKSNDGRIVLCNDDGSLIEIMKR